MTKQIKGEIMKNFLITLMSALMIFTSYGESNSSNQNPIIFTAEELQQLLNEAMILATKDKELERLKWLINKGANVNARTKENRTALMWVSKKGYIEIVDFLLKIDAINVNVRNNKGGTALMAASWEGHIEIVELLLEADADFNISSYKGWTALKLASHKGHTQIEEILKFVGAKE